MNVRQLRDRYRVRPGYWFRPKLFGYGAVPVTWQGWAATFALVVGAAMIANVAQHHSTIYAALLAPLIVGFLYLCWVKTDGDWRWRWGNEED